MHLPHFLDFVKVYDEASFVSVILLNAFPTKHGEVVGAVEVLDSLVMLVTEETVDAFFIFEVDVSQNAVSFYDFVKDIEVQRQPINAFNLLHQFAANGTSHSEVVMQACQALSAKRVAAVNQYPGNALSNVEFFSAIVAKIKTSGLVISLGERSWLILAFFFF